MAITINIYYTGLNGGAKKICRGDACKWSCG